MGKAPALAPGLFDSVPTFALRWSLKVAWR